MSESFREQLARLECMAQDDDGTTWDLSPNDLAAIRAVLDAYYRLLRDQETR